MSSNRKLSVKKLIPSFMVKNTIEDNGNTTWSGDTKCSSLPNLAMKSNSTFPNDPGSKDCDVDGEGDEETRKQSYILRNFKLKSLTKRRNLDITFSRPGKNSLDSNHKGPVRVITHENKYDKYPGSDHSRGSTDGQNVDLTASAPQKSAPVIDVSKHQFSESIGYIKKSPRRINQPELAEHTCKSSSRPTLNSIGDNCPPNIDGTEGLYEDGNIGRQVVPTAGLSDSISSGNESNITEPKFPKDRPPARPPKPLKLRGEPLNKSVKSSENELPPRPPARHPSVHQNFPTIRAVQLLHGYRESGAYECIDEPEPVLPEFGLPGELRKLPHQPWYWGPLTQEEAEEKLRGLADGHFLVRDSSDERYLLSLSFNSNGRPVHTRFEYVGGQFSINDSQGYLSVVDLIEDAVRESQNGVYSFMQNVNGTQTFPARLTNPVSRFTEMKSLQHLCRFVIRETFPRHYIADLPVPQKIKKYILENQY